MSRTGAQAGTSGGLDIQISNNTIPQPTGTNQNLGGGPNQPLPEAGISVLVDRFNTAGDPNNTLRADIFGNNVYDPNVWQPGFTNPSVAIVLAARSNSTFQLEGTAANAVTQLTNTNAVSNDNNGNDADNYSVEPGSVVTIVPDGTAGPFPLLAPSGGVEANDNPR